MHVVIKEAVNTEEGGYQLTGRTILLDAEAPYFDALPDGGAHVRRDGWMVLESPEFDALAHLIKECEDDPGTG